MQLVGAVMAGGRSSRFGRDKALLEIGGETLLQRTVRVVRSVVPAVIVLGPPERAEQVAGVDVLQDERTGIGPLGGICTVLKARPSCAALVVAVDMPFLSAPLLGYLIELAGDVDLVLPIIGGRGQQLHAIYGQACLPHIESQIAHDDYKIDRFFSRVRVRQVFDDEASRFDPGLRSFRNVNTQQAWDEARTELQAR